MLKASDEPNSKSCANYGGVLPKRRRYWWKIKVNLRSDRFYLKQIALDMPMPEVGHIRYHLLWLARNIRWHLALLRAEASAAAGRGKPVAEETGGRSEHRQGDIAAWVGKKMWSKVADPRRCQ